MEWIFWIILAVFIVISFNLINSKLRRTMLLEKYKSEDIVDKIMHHNVWIGQTEEQLFDAIGDDLDIEQK